jgi:hypothetical protein
MCSLIFVLLWSPYALVCALRPSEFEKFTLVNLQAKTLVFFAFKKRSRTPLPRKYWTVIGKQKLLQFFLSIDGRTLLSPLPECIITCIITLTISEARCRRVCNSRRAGFADS